MSETLGDKICATCTHPFHDGFCGYVMAIDDISGPISGATICDCDFIGTAESVLKEAADSLSVQTASTGELPIGNYVGMPAGLMLEEFGSQVWHVFGDCPYLVGSATRSKHWRDVDVRLILPDEEYEALGFTDPARGPLNGKWTALCLAFSALGKQMTGLPIDFQIQQMTYANKKFSGSRMALGFVALRMKGW